ncbi:MAG: glycoside hydrolase family 2 [Armatimonadetes bacterium]|nr:glycoside hydrolase family 2 [Armatimonadota bacterium]
MTRWADQVNPARPLPEYPRPQLVRSEWLNLNGIWEYQSGAAGDALPTGRKLSSEILVPYPVESALSGVMEHHDRLWYRRSFTVPAAWKGRQLMLNFGAVDYEAEVFVNGQRVGIHTGGYDPFSYDVSPYLKGNGPQELIVRVFDPTDAGGQPRGKQAIKPGGIMYTSTTGIWQTVWLEPVARTSIRNLRIVPDVDTQQVRLQVNAQNTTPQTRVIVKIKDLGRVIRTVEARPNSDIAIPISNPKLWSPERPFLYELDVNLVQKRTVTDRVGSYFGMRKISLGTDRGVKKMFLNNNFVFQMGPLDQGFWPDGIYTAPTDEALKFDIEMTKKLGFNMTRKHIKVEPARWYYWADKMGLLVWQDMPSPNSYTRDAPPIDKAAFEKELNNVITSLWNAPSIIMWVVFNENQARHDTARLVNMTKTLDPSRLVNRDSGAGFEGGEEGAVGDIDDVHSYTPPASPGPSPTQALVCGEYGGIGYVVKGHTWKGEGWGYSTVPSQEDLEDTYGEFTTMLKQFRDARGLSAAVYTQITDVEREVNGLLTYDRVLKCDPKQIALANRLQYPVLAYREILPTSEKQSQTWKYTFTAPPAEWNQKAFDDATWQRGPGGFGGGFAANFPHPPRIATPWTTSDIWLRRTFTLGNLSAEQVSRLLLRAFHDDEVEVFINGVLAYSTGGFTRNYEHQPIKEEAKRSLVLNGENVMAIHCHQRALGQYIDVGIMERIPAPR